MIFDLHTHTKRSFDAFTTENELLLACKVKGINVIGITEHDLQARVNFETFRKDRIFALNGIEFTTKEGVHIIGFFDDHLTIDRQNSNKEKIIAYIKDNGGVLVMPHPLKKSTGYLSVYGEDEFVGAFDFIELVNGGDLKNAMNNDLLRLAEKYSLKPLSSSDSHSVEQIGMCVTKINIENNFSTANEVLALLRKISGEQITLLIESSVDVKKRDVARYKKTMIYQSALNLIPQRARRIIKLLKNRLSFSGHSLKKSSWISIEKYMHSKNIIN